MRLGGKPGNWLWRRLRLGGWFAQRKAERAAETAPETTPSRRRGKGRGGPHRHRKKRR